MQQGSCLCGAITYSFNNHEGDFVHCHCRSCRKSGGTNGAINIAVAIEQFNLSDPSGLLKNYESSPNKFRHFCSHCGSPLFTKVGGNAEYVRVRLGSVDSSFTEAPKAHIFMAHKAHWDHSNLSLTEYDEWPDFNKLDIRGATRGKHSK